MQADAREPPAADAEDEAAGKKRVEEMCAKLLANTVIEDYRLET